MFLFSIYDWNVSRGNYILVLTKNEFNNTFLVKDCSNPSFIGLSWDYISKGGQPLIDMYEKLEF